MKWINTKTPPLESGYYLCIYYTNLPYILMYHKDENTWKDEDANSIPTHWMPLPTPPDKE